MISRFKIPLIAFLISRLIIVLAIHLPTAAGIRVYIDFGVEASQPPLVRPWARWDAVWYARVAADGYRYTPDSLDQAENSTAFFPLLPLSMAFAAPIFGGAMTAGLVISNGCFLAALILLYRWARTRLNATAAVYLVWLLALFPTSFYFSAPYTESLFLLLTVIAVMAAERRAWWIAGIAAALASATRAQGVLIGIVIVWEFGRAHDWKVASIARDVRWLALMLIPLGLFAYMLYLHVTFGDAFAFSAAQRAWGRQVVGPVAAILTTLTTVNAPHRLPYFGVLEVIFFFAALVLIVPLWRRLGAGYALYTLATLLLLSLAWLEGQFRFVLVLFPVFALIAWWTSSRPRVFRLIVAVCIPVLAVSAFLFTNWVFLG